jgi:hypothetical protein
MTKQQINDFSAWGESFLQSYCDDKNCKAENIPLKYAVNTAKSHLENLECYDEDDLEIMYGKDHYNEVKQFIKKYSK